MPLEPNRSLLHYRLVEKIGEGGMGVVWKAVDTTLDREVAIKVLPDALASDPARLARFEREAKLLAAVNHPNIAAIYGLHECDGLHFLVMELISGEDLSKRIDKGEMSIDAAVRIGVEVAAALETAHENGIIHRDLKPANIMLTAKGYATVMDFGLAKRLVGEGGTDQDVTESEATLTMAATNLTREGTTIGTLAYMSPELLRTEPADARSDIFSLGIVLYELLTGVHPFRKPQALETVSGILRDDPPPLSRHRQGVPEALERTIRKLLAKQPDQRFQEIAEARSSLEGILQDLSGAVSVVPTATPASLVRSVRRPRVAIPIVLMAALLTAGGVWFTKRQAKIRWATEEVLPEIERLVDASWRDFTDAYDLALEAAVYIPDDPRLEQLLAKCSLDISVATEPAGADIYFKNYASPLAEWRHLGVSPMESVRLPIGILRWKIEKPGYEPVMAASSTWDISLGAELLIPNDLVRVLDRAGEIPPGMVRVQGAETGAGKLQDFYIDRYEVTNLQFKKFVDDGGYRTEDYWKHEWVEDGVALSWQEAMARFVDQTGRPGPATWQAGDYPEGAEEYPVSGISWYEAAAYAEFLGKNLPTGTHWGLARGESTPLVRFPQLGGYAVFAPFSNFEGRGPVAVGDLPGITAFGAYDMAGNVREWCFNDMQAGKLLRGGAWSDTTYMFRDLSQAPPMDRSAKNGFRCALYVDLEQVPESVFAPVQLAGTRDVRVVEPVSDAVFEVFRGQFSYDPTELDARVESTKDNYEDWVQEKITFDAAYGGERMIAHLFLPRNTTPPYQTVVYFPGSGSIFHESSDDIETYFEFPVFLSFILKSGRAVLYPVVKGTFERRDLALAQVHLGGSSHLYAEYVAQLVKDFSRSVDYLESREDIDSDKLAYYGMSWGAMFGAIVPAVEDRLKASVLLSGGVVTNFQNGEVASYRPEADPLNYLPRVKVPTLMINGRYDTILTFEHSIQPMFDLLGTPDEHKQLRIFDTDHIPPRTEFIRETLAWFDRYLGPVNAPRTGEDGG